MSVASEEQFAQSIGKTIARHRQARGLTQEEVAERLGIGNEAVSRIERGVVIPTLPRLMELAELFQCQTVDFLTASSHRPADQANYIHQLLQKLDKDDRAMLVVMIEKLAARLRNSVTEFERQPAK